MITKQKEVVEFLKHSNWIENEHSKEALFDAKYAWQWALENRNEIDLSYILKVHRILLKNLKPDIAGKIRKVNVMVGGRICPNPGQLNRLLITWFDYHKDAKTEEQIKLAHIVFEKIHCFEDGNGRTGRIIYNVQRLKANLPLHIIHQGVEQYEYYKWFK